MRRAAGDFISVDWAARPRARPPACSTALCPLPLESACGKQHQGTNVVGALRTRLRKWMMDQTRGFQNSNEDTTARHRVLTEKPRLETLASVVERNIEALLQRRRNEDRSANFQQRASDKITAFTGSMTFVFLHLALFGSWIIVNLGWIPGIKKFDPSFVVLAMIASVEAIFLSTFVLISQNRMQAIADKRADLDLQISLLAEHEVTQLVTLVREIAARMGIEAAGNPELSELELDVAPERVLDEMEEHERRLEAAKKGS
jgi:uncharacterized membrane protein